MLEKMKSSLELRKSYIAEAYDIFAELTPRQNLA